MPDLSGKPLYLRLVALFAVLAIVVAACGDTTQTEGETDAPEGSGPAASEPDTAGGDLGTYTLGMFEDMTTDNFWNSYDIGGTVYNSYVLDPTGCALYGTAYPGIETQANIANEEEIPPATQEGDTWIGEVTIRDGVTWSDGEPLTANDVAFTWQTAVDFQLTQNWGDLTDADIVTAVEAVDDSTVRVTFNAQPGLAQWGPGTNVLQMPIQPEHFWGPIVEEVSESEDPRTELLAASGADAPACGATIFESRQEGSFVNTVANDSYYDAGAELSSGGVTWTEGPYADNFNFPIYGGQEPAVLALAEGEVDYLLNPLGMQRGFQEQVEENEDLTAIVNPTNGFRFLAFNHSRAPMSDPAFRDAMAALINKEFVTQNLLQGVAFPLYVILPEGNTKWYNEEVAAELAEVGYAGLEDNERKEIAIDLLKEAGYTWQTEPAFDEEGTFTAGAGIIDPDGNPIEQLELIHPTASYDPLRATFGGYIAGVAQEMGIPIVSVPTDFNKIVADVFATDPDDPTVFTSNFDMFILGYSLGNAAFPSFHGSFFATGGDSNNTQYSNEEYDAADAAYDSAQSEDEAFEAMWEMERLIARDKPHVPLFDTGILEFYSNRVEYPFTDTLSGLQFLYGQQSAVQAR